MLDAAQDLVYLLDATLALEPLLGCFIIETWDRGAEPAECGSAIAEHLHRMGHNIYDLGLPTGLEARPSAYLFIGASYS